MRKFLTRLVEPSAHEKGTSLQTRIFNILLLSFAVLLALAIVITAILFVAEPSSFGVGPLVNIALVVTVTAVAYFLSRQKRVQLAIQLFSLGIIVATTVSLTTRGTANMITLVYAIAIVITGLLLWPTSTFLVALLCAVLYAGVVIWQSSHPPLAPYTETGFAVYNITALTVSLLVLAMVVWLVAVILRRSVGALQESEERHRLFSEITSDFAYVYRVEADGRLVRDWGDASFLDIVGMTQEEIAADDAWVRFIPAEDLSRVQQSIHNLLAGQEDSLELRVIDSNGNVQWMHNLARPVWDETEGRVVRIYGAVQDVTARKQRQERIHLLSTVIEQSTEGVAVMNLEGELLFINDAFAALHGYTAQELVGKHISVFHTPAQMPAVEAANRQIQETGQFNGEIWHVRRDGTEFPTWMQNTLLHDEAGKPIGMIGALRDITAIKDAQDQLAREAAVNAAMAELSEKLMAAHSTKDVAALTLEEALRFTHSPSGYVGYIDPETGHLISPALSGELWGPPEAAGEEIAFGEPVGLWGWVLEHGQPLLTNDAAQDPRSCGFPAGTAPLRRFLSVPAWHGETLVGQITLANAEQDYDKHDLVAVQRLATIFALGMRRVQVELALRASEHQHRVTLDLMADAIHVVNRDLEFTLLNETFRQWNKKLGLEEAVIGKNIFHVFPFLSDRIKDEYRHVLETGQPLFTQGERNFIDGVEFVTETRKIPVFHEGRVTQVVTVIRDVTSQERATERLHHYMERLQTMRDIDQAILMAHSPSAIAGAALQHLGELIPYQRAEVAVIDNRTGDPAVLAVHANHGRKRSPNGHEAETMAQVAVPLLAQGESIGSLNLATDIHGGFTAEQVDVAREVADSLAVAIQNARLLEIERQRSTELETLRRAGLDLTSSLELQAVLEAILDHALQLLAADDAHFFLYDGQTLTFGAALWSGGRQQKPYAEPRPDGLTYTVARSGERIVISDVDRHSLFADWQWGGSIVGLPLRMGDRVVGVMTLGFVKPRGFANSELNALELLADQAAIAVENARLFQVEQQQKLRLALLADVARITTSSLDAVNFLQSVAESIHRHFPYPIVELFTLQDQGLVLRGYRGITTRNQESVTPGVYRQSLETGIVGLVARTGESYLAKDVQADPHYYSPEPTSTRSEICVPILDEDRVIGVVNVESDQAGDFGAEDLSLLQALADTVAIGLRNIHLYQEAHRRVQELTLLNRISVGFGSALDLDALIRGALAGVQELIRVDRVYFITIDTDAQRWETTQYLAHPDFAVNAGLSGSFHRAPTEIQSLLRGEPFVVTDIAADERIAAMREVYGSLGIRSLLLLPVRPRERLYGALGLDACREPRAWHDDEIRLLQGITHQLGLALENVQLFQEVRRHADELEVALAQQQELDRLKNEFIQNVSHELRSPIALIQGYADLLAQGEFGPIVPQQQPPIDIIARRARMLGELVEDITLILGTEARPLLRESLDAGELVRAAVQDFSIAANLGGLTLKADIDPDSLTVGGEMIYLRRVLDNLLSNAIKFTPPGGTVTVAARRKGEQVVLQVVDDGIGIAPDQQDLIFERFYQVDGSTRRRYGGVGLGLALVREVVTAMDGTVDVTSEPGQGSTFTVTLPALVPETPGD
ncbi:MAG: GAF domain-containing protein [Anaerolineae bacterium]|nr:GAF domain-containing protein [Anaerolineae bacterium]